MGHHPDESLRFEGRELPQRRHGRYVGRLNSFDEWHTHNLQCRPCVIARYRTEIFDQGSFGAIDTILYPTQRDDRRCDLRILVRYVGQFFYRLDLQPFNTVLHPAQGDDGRQNLRITEIVHPINRPCLYVVNAVPYPVQCDDG